MKKILLSLAIAVGLTATAGEVKFDFKSETYGLERLSGQTTDYINEGTTITHEGVTLTFKSNDPANSKNESGSRLWTNGIRMYTGSTITITADGKNITSVTMTPVVNNIKIGESTTGTWTGEAPEVVMAYTATSKNAEFATLTITYGEGGTTVPEPTVVKTVKETLALASGTKVTVNYALTVGYVKNSNVYACDAAGDFIQLYGANTLMAGDVIPAGWTATYDFYKEITPELKDFGTLPAVTEGTFTPAVVAAADVTNALVNHVVTINNVVLEAATPAADEKDNNKKNFTGKVGDVELSLRNHYGLESVDAGTYNITVVVTIYENAPSLYVVKFAEVSSTGINEIVADEAEAVYYNLQGVRVTNPENGLYIRVRGNKVDKVVK